MSSPLVKGDGGSDTRAHWNRRWSERVPAPEDRAPAPWLVASEPLLARPPARALDVACGDGRNALYLAQRGFVVDAVDISDVAIDALATAARACNLAVHPCRRDLERQPLPARGYDLIVQIRYLQRSLFPALAAALAPGGILVMETFARGHSGMSDRYLLERGELLRVFPDLRVLRYRQSATRTASGARVVTGVVAQRPR